MHYVEEAALNAFNTVVRWVSLLWNFIQLSLNSGSVQVQTLLSVSEIRDGEDLWQWSQLEIRLNAFRRSTIPQKQFIINSLFILFDKIYTGKIHFMNLKFKWLIIPSQQVNSESNLSENPGKVHQVKKNGKGE